MRLPELNWKIWLFAFLFLACLIFLYKGLDNYQVVLEATHRLFKLLSPFATGLLLAYLLHIPCRGIEHLLLKIPGRVMTLTARPLSVVLLLLIVSGFIAGVISFIIPPIQQSIVDVTNNLPLLLGTAVDIVKQLRINLDQWNIQQIIAFPFDYLFSNFNLQKVYDASINAVSGIFSFFVALVVAIYILLNPAPFLNAVKRIACIFLKEESIKTLSRYVTKTNTIFYKFISCQLLDALIIGTISGVVMGLFNIRYAALLAVVLAILNVIPFVGAFVGVAIAATTTLITGGLSQALIVLIFLIVLQQVDGNIIIPRLLGQSLNLNPVIIILAITIGGAYYGIWGMFLSVPVVAVLKIILGDVLHLMEERNERRRRDDVAGADG